MNFPFFASFIIFIVWLAYELKKAGRLHEKKNLEFWERESAANATRRKSLALLDYIHIPLDTLPVHTLENDETVISCIQTLEKLQQAKIVNLTGFSNTDLKLKYGAANLNELTEYDQNFTELVTTLQTWADALYQSGAVAEAAAVLEFAVSVHSDVSTSYFMLAKIYAAAGASDKIAPLIKAASELNSLSRDIIVRTLKESYPYSG